MFLHPRNRIQITSKRLLILLVLLGLLLRLFQLGEWSFWHDEALTVLTSRHSVSDILLFGTTNEKPPLYFFLVKAFMWFGQSEFIVRLASALCGAGTILALFLLGHALFDERVGLVAAFIMTISPLQLVYAQEARMYTMLLLLLIFCVWCLMRALRAGESRSAFAWWGLFTLSATLSMYTHYFAFPVFVATGLYMLLIDRQRQHILQFSAASGLAVLFFLPWLGVLFSQTQTVLTSFWIEQPHPLKILTTLVTFFVSYSLPPRESVVASVATLFIVVVVLNDVRHALKRGESARPLLWLLLWGFVPLIGVYLIGLIRPLFLVRTVITAAPAFYLLVAWGLMRSPQKKINRLFFVPALSLILISVFHFYQNPAFAKPPWRRAAAYVQQGSEPGDVVIHTDRSTFVVFLVYPHTVEHIWLNDATAQSTPAELGRLAGAAGGGIQPFDQAVQGHQRVWVVGQIPPELRRRFEASYRLREETMIVGLPISTYTSR